jgi:hypothetical protein
MCLRRFEHLVTRQLHALKPVTHDRVQRIENRETTLQNPRVAVNPNYCFVSG